MMKSLTVEDLAGIPFRSRDAMPFIRELAAPEKWQFQTGCGTVGEISLASGICFRTDSGVEVPQTAMASLKRILDAKAIPADGRYPVAMRHDSTLTGCEEYRIETDWKETKIAAGGTDGMRRALYHLGELLRQTEGASLPKALVHRKAWVKRRISRCFFAPTYRAPFFIDELNDETDYYPESYLDKLAADGVNGLWISVYFRDLPSTFFPGRGENAEKRFAKLRNVTRRCGKYGIKVYLYCCEPKRFGNGSFAVPLGNAAAHPEVVGTAFLGDHYFCMSSDTAKQYLYDSAFQLFHAVPELGGMIAILFGEDNGSCANASMYDRTKLYRCPKCGSLPPGRIFGQMADALYRGMHDAAPEAELIGWFYAPGIRDDGGLAERLKDVVKHYPEHSSIMFNFESGGVSMQLGKPRNVYDYSLSYIGPSKLFRFAADHSDRPAAKLQVCCSHEDASIPFVPVPGNLYRKYRILHDLNVRTILQCWYFGNYPGLMNRAAGKLSFMDFSESEEAFLMELALPDWGRYAEDAVRGWQHFAASYREFPANIAFAWYGPLHHSIVWPLHLFPVDEPMAPSWILKNFPEVSGDRFGECMIYQHTPREILILLERMEREWNAGLAVFAPLKKIFGSVEARQHDIDLAEAIGLQIRSALNCMKFYTLREEMLYQRVNHLDAMRGLAEAEICNSRAMFELCRRDSRLGYHSEAENYLFFPEKLECRIALLEQLLREDFPNFDLKAEWIGRYTGKTTDENAYDAADASWHDVAQSGIHYKLYQTENSLQFELRGHIGRHVVFEIEPCRMWPPLRIETDPDGSAHFYEIIFRNPPGLNFDYRKDGTFAVKIPLEIFDGYRREGFPMRFTVRSGNVCSRGKCRPWPYRLLHEDYNPHSASWLYGVETRKKERE